MILKLAFAAVLASSGASLAQTAATPALPPAAISPAVSGPMSTTTTPIGDLLANPAAKGVIETNLPGFSANPQVQMALGMTLKDAQPYSNGAITDEKLAAIDAGLAKLPAPH